MQALLVLARGIDRVTAFIGKVGHVADPAGGSRQFGQCHRSKAVQLVVQFAAGDAVVSVRRGVHGGAAAYTLQQNEHIRIDVFYGTRTRRTQHWIDLFGHVFFTLPFVVLMTWLLVPYALQAFNSGQISTNAGGLIIWPRAGNPGPGLRPSDRAGNLRDHQEDRRHAGPDRRPASTLHLSAHEAAELEGKQLAETVAKLAANDATGEKR